MALAAPERRIAVITGDGELMMNAGALATVASAAPQNLIIVCIDNGQHGETGGQPGHTSKRTNLTTLAEGSGIASVMTVSAPEDLSAARDFLADGIAPKFLWVQYGLARRRITTATGIWSNVVYASGWPTRPTPEPQKFHPSSGAGLPAFCGHSDGDPELVELQEPTLGPQELASTSQ